MTKIKVGLRLLDITATTFSVFCNQGLPTYVINPLHQPFPKIMSLRKTKTDQVDAKTIAAMLMSNVDLKSPTQIQHTTTKS